MEKRYQVFVSSTFLDLRVERSQVIQALLELDCIPSGMELFPAADEDQWSYIQQIIDDCDYYVVLLAGKYGSISKRTGKSYTQMEYEYAIATGKPVIAFFHDDLNSLSMEKSETELEKRELLEKFHSLVKERLCRPWHNTDQLAGLVALSMAQLIKRKPAIGWIRADRVADESAAQEIVRLRRNIEELEFVAQRNAHSNLFALGINIEELAQGDDIFPVHLRFDYWQEGPGSSRTRSSSTVELKLTWDKIFDILSKLISWQSEEVMFSQPFSKILTEIQFGPSPPPHFENFHIDENDFLSIKVQLQLLGLVTILEKDENSLGQQWFLTDKGQLYVLRNNAVKKLN